MILTLMFVMVGNVLFMFYCPTYRSLFAAWCTITNASMGNFVFTDFDHVDDNFPLQIFGKVYLMAVVLIFLILMLNLVIAILTNVYNIYENLSIGLFLTKILSSREQLESDEYYGAFISSIIPFNILIIPFIPFGLMMGKSEKLMNLN